MTQHVQALIPWVEKQHRGITRPAPGRGLPRFNPASHMALGTPRSQPTPHLQNRHDRSNWVARAAQGTALPRTAGVQQVATSYSRPLADDLPKTTPLRKRLALSVEIQTGAATAESSATVPQEVKNGSAWLARSVKHATLDLGSRSPESYAGHGGCFKKK